MLGLEAGDHISHEDVIYFQAKEFQIIAQNGVAIDIDGEDAGEVPANIRVLPGHLEILVP